MRDISEDVDKMNMDSLAPLDYELWEMQRFAWQER